MFTLKPFQERAPRFDFKKEKASYGRYGIHDYPAMLHYLVVKEILKEYGHGKKILYDPFCGSGVSLCEGLRAGLSVYGTDINPLALLIAKVRCPQKIPEFPVEYILYVLRNATPDISEIKNATYWFKDYVIEFLGKIRGGIKEFQGRDFYELLLVAFSQTVREVSNNRKGEFKRFRLEEKELHRFQPDVPNTFLKNLLDYYSRLVFDSWETENRTLHLDSESLGGKVSEQSTYFSKTLNETVEALKLIVDKRAREVVSFYYDLFLACRNIAGKLNPKATVCFVVGNRTVKGIRIPMDEIVKEIFEYLGLKHRKTFIREIHRKRMPSQNSPTNIAGQKSTTMKQEFIVIIEKE